MLTYKAHLGEEVWQGDL